MNVFALIVVLFLAAVVACFHFLRSDSRQQKRAAGRKLAPGPYPLPFVGNIFQLGRNPHRSLAKLSKTFGPLMSLHLGNIYAVVVSSPEIAKQVLQKHDLVFSGRFNPAAVHVHDHHKISVICLPPVGNEWKKLRKICREKLFSTHCLDATQGLRQENLQRLSEYVQKRHDSGREVNIGEAAFVTMLNLMSSTLFSAEFTNFDSDTNNQEFKETINGVTRYVGVPNIADFFPILKPVDPQGIKRKLEFYLGKMLAIIEDIINQRLKSRATTLTYQKKNDLLETLLDLSEGSEYQLTTKEIKHLLTDLIIAGADTSASTTEWTMTELLLNPEKLSKVKHELRTVIGEKKQVQESDMSRLPYFQAVIKEVFRLHPAGPLLGPHKSEDEVQIGGYIIPKDTKILINVWAISRDPSLWPNPNSFQPERFLDRKIDFKGQDFELIPFGSGRRICPGLPLANRMLHGMVSTLIHNFDWKFEAGDVEAKEVHRREVFGIALQKAIPLKAIPIKL